MIEYPLPPPLCTGSGTVAADFTPTVSSLPTVGRCGICGHDVPLMYDSQTIAPHAYSIYPQEGQR